MNFAGYTEIVAVNLCVCTSVRKRWERAFGIRSNCICPRTDYIEKVITCVKISRNVVASLVLSCLMYWPTLLWSQTVRGEVHGLV